MSFPGSLRGLHPSRSRRLLSNEGPVPGIRYNRIRHGADYASPPGLDQIFDSSRRANGQDPQVYDPWNPHYGSNLGYDPPYPHDAIALHPHTPPFMLELPPLPARSASPRRIRYRDSVLTPEAFDLILNRTLSRHASSDDMDSISFDEAMTGIRPPEVVESRFPVADDLARSMAPTVSTMEADFSSPMLPFMPDERVGVEPPSPAATDHSMPPNSVSFEPPMFGPEPIQSLEAVVNQPIHGLAIEPMEMDPFAVAEAMMPMAEAALLLELPMMEIHDPIGAMHAMTLDTLVEQLAPEPIMQPPDMLDPFQTLQQQFDHHMQLMDPFNMMGPMG